jgi:5-hydroxyisourate hydrolase-like protein (transthyretin family)
MVNPLIATLTIDAPDLLTLTLGKTIIITATLKDENGAPIQNATIGFYLFKDETWELIGSRETNSDGIAVFEYTPPATGKFYIKAEFLGTQIYGKTSDVITLNVNFDYTPYILVGVVAIAAIALITFAIWKKKKKTSRVET